MLVKCIDYCQRIGLFALVIAEWVVTAVQASAASF